MKEICMFPENYFHTELKKFALITRVHGAHMLLKVECSRYEKFKGKVLALTRTKIG
jgi:hypothetical protein